MTLVVEYLVLPQLAGTRKAINTLSRVDGWYLLIGVGLEAGSIVAYTQLTRAMLPCYGVFRNRIMTITAGPACAKLAGRPAGRAPSPS